MRRQLVACRRRETVWIDPDNTGRNAGHQRAGVEKGAKTRAIQLVRSSLRRRPNHRRPDTHGDKSAKPRPPAANWENLVGLQAQTFWATNEHKCDCARRREHESDKLIQAVIGAAYEVLNVFGAGFFEKVYERALIRETGRAGNP